MTGADRTGHAGWRGSLRTRTLVIVVVTFLVLYAATSSVLNTVVMDAYRRDESRDITEKAKQAMAVLNNMLADLGNLTADWAEWDDTYTFIQDSNERYTEANLLDATFINNRLNVMLYVDAAGRTVYGKAYSFSEERPIPFPESLAKEIYPGGLLLRHTGAGSRLTGIITLAEAPMLLAANPILTSEGKGPAPGTLIFGRYLDAAEVEHLATVTGLSLTTYRPDEPDLPADFAAAVRLLSRSSPVTTQVLGPDTIAGYTLLPDIYQKPALVLRVDAPRAIYTQGQRTVLYFQFALLGIGLIYILVVLGLLEKLVISPVTNLSRRVSAIGSTADHAAQLPVAGKDEVSSLASAMNDMLARLASTQKALKESEARFRRLAENARDIIWRFQVSPEFRLVYVSPSATDILGYTPDELLNEPSLIARVLHQDALSLLESLKETPAAAWPDTSGVLHCRRRDGTLVWLETRNTLVYGETGEVIAVEGIARDVTEHQRLEAERERLYQQEKELRQQMETEIRRRSEFTRALVHELKTPLTPILASSDLLAEEIRDEPYRRVARNINQGALKLNERVDELLDLAKGEVGMLQLNRKLLDPSALLRQVADYMTPVARDSGHWLSVRIASPLPFLLADEDRVRQVIINLLSNAIKFAPAGEITLSAHVAGRDLVVSVHDEGEPITEEEQQQLFQAYHRLERDREQPSGLGLGLTIAKMLVELHGGKIWLESGREAGNTFAFSLPIDAATSPDGARGGYL